MGGIGFRCWVLGDKDSKCSKHIPLLPKPCKPKLDPFLQHLQRGPAIRAVLIRQETPMDPRKTDPSGYYL